VHQGVYPSQSVITLGASVFAFNLQS